VAGPGRATPPAPQLRRVASKAGVRRRFAPHQLHHAHAIELAHEGVPLNVIQRQLGHTNLGRHVHLPAGDRQRRDHRHRPRPPGANDPRQCRTPHLSRPGPTGAPELLASRTSSTPSFPAPAKAGAAFRPPGGTPAWSERRSEGHIGPPTGHPRRNRAEQGKSVLNESRSEALESGQSALAAREGNPGRRKPTGRLGDPLA
jgi:Phage integrase family